jgi:hypothetical protein
VKNLEVHSILLDFVKENENTLSDSLIQDKAVYNVKGFVIKRIWLALALALSLKR